MHQYIQSNFVLGSQSPFSALSTADIKQHLNISDSGQDGYLSSLLASAVMFVERRIQLDIRETIWTLQLDRFPGYWCIDTDGFGYGGWGYGPFAGGSWWTYPSRYMMRRMAIPLQRGPLVSLNSVKYFDTANTQQTMTTGQYTYSKPSYFPADLEPTTVWPVAYARPDAVSINFTTGMNPVPVSLCHAIRLLCGQWYASRENISYGPQTAMGNTGCAVEALLDQFQVVGLG